MSHFDRPPTNSLQIDDLIIIPNHLTAPPPEGGGSALKNLAMIASRYQGTKNTMDHSPEPKRARVESGECAGQSTEPEDFKLCLKEFYSDIALPLTVPKCGSRIEML